MFAVSAPISSARGNGAFTDKSATSGIARLSLPYLGFGCEFLDFDNDGWKDLIVANGQVMEDVGQMSDGTTFAERKSLYHKPFISAWARRTKSPAWT